MSNWEGKRWGEDNWEEDNRDEGGSGWSRWSVVLGAAGACLLALALAAAGCGETDEESGAEEWAGQGERWDDAARWWDGWSEEEAPTLETTWSDLNVVTWFFSQNDPKWTCAKLGTCYKTTMGTCTGDTPAGCAVAAAAMVLKSKGAAIDPGVLNTWLKNNGGYSGGCLIVWSKVADYDGPGGLVWKTTGSLASPADLKSKLDAGYRIIAKSKRFSSGHWVAVSGYTGTGTAWSHFTYWDPWDKTPITRKIGDNGWVVAGAATRLYK